MMTNMAFWELIEADAIHWSSTAQTDLEVTRCMARIELAELNAALETP